MMPPAPKIGLIILAAGNSTRLNGQEKQMLVFKGRTLLRRAVETALQTKFEKIVVVVSSQNNDYAEQLESLPVVSIINKNANSGISSSIKAGLAVFAQEAFDAALIMLCDQPLITPEILENIVEIYTQTGKPIVSCKYEKTVGVPALFDRKFFAELMSLEADEGAKKIIVRHKQQTAFLDVPQAGLDVDTLEDYVKLLNSHFK